ncbi:kinase-like protein [Cystobasidium minutum MCA 4210]|uniref:kinase-like protein n=1 Tax=Cystobasidium minutum MCA 4210 TaxID=1397322 RepID=UPI0034CFA8D4|eukprot:jgi/Rhomi1/173689/fgenesh1_kg.6_\
MLAANKKNRNIRGLTIAQESHKPGAAAALTATTQGTIKPRANHKSTVSGSTTSSNSSLSLPTDASGSESTLSSPSLPSSAFSSSAGSTSYSNRRSSSHQAYQNKLTEQLANLEIGVEFKLDLRAEDIEAVSELGHGNGGTVTKVRHIPTGAMMARKVVHIDAKQSVRKQILRELQIMHDCSSIYIVSFYGAYLQDPHICMCMEHMDKGSFDNIYKKVGPIPEDVLGQIALAMVSGLTYLYDVHRIIHRDVKPSNVLFNSQGQIKICDFGVSGELINSIAETFVGTSTYMSPERIQGAQYSVKSDVWSLGITLVELALGRFPFSNDDEEDDSDFDEDDYREEELTLSPVKPLGREKTLAELDARRREKAARIAAEKKKEKKDNGSGQEKKKKGGVSLGGSGSQMSILELLQHVVNEPAPRLKPEGKFKKEAEEFVDACLEKDVNRRPTPKELLKYKWLIEAKETEVDLEGWAKTIP